MPDEMTIRLIINADDFGYSEAINEAVLRAHREGVLTSASLMVTGDAMEQAVAIALENPGLAVGLHLAVTSAKSALPREVVPDLVGSEGWFSSNPALAAFKYYFSRKAREQLKREISAQFELFAQTGLQLSHVDGHQHLHAHPAVLPMVIELAGKYGASGIRVPHDPFWVNFKVDRSRLGVKVITAAGHWYLAWVCRRMLAKTEFVTTDLCIGSMMSGAMWDDYLISLLDKIKDGIVEVYCHPSAVDPVPRNPYGPNSGDFQALLSPALKDYLNSKNYQLTNYIALKQMEAASESA